MISGIDHVGIAVRSIEESRRFYETLGLEVEAIEDVESEGVRVALIPCGDGRIELLEATSPESPIARFIENRGVGIHHICLATSDVRSDQQLLEGSGFEVLRPEPTRGAEGCWVQFIHPKSAGGVLIELSQRTQQG